MTKGKTIGSGALAAAAGMLLTSVSAGAQTTPTDPVVSTTEGQLRGQVSKGVYSFLGIHYGADTGGKNRFLPPKPPGAWSGVRRAAAMGDRCPQPPVNMPPEIASVLSFSDLPMSEDCLVLNVWTPAPNDGKKRPVMVWLHGGGFFLGSGGDKYYEGSNLAREEDVVVVTLNHRLNGFGFLALGAEAGPEYESSGLAGMLDIVQALKWVNSNVAKFGGDPNNVTIFGQSGGGGKTTLLTAMPAAKGLIHKAIIMSGASYRVGEPAAAVAARDKFLGALGVKPNEIARLQAMPMQDLVAASGKVGLLGFSPSYDGKVLPGHPYDPAAPAISATIPLMVGTTKDEATNVFLSDPTWPKMTEEDLLKRVSGVVGAYEAPKVIAMYRAQAPDDKPMHLFTSIMTDQIFTTSTVTLVERKVAQGTAPTYVYRVDWETPVLGGKLRAPHAVELPFVFDNVDVSAGLVGPAGADQERMARQMSSTFAAFARTGNPNVKGYPTWPAYELKTRPTFIYDTPPSIVSDLNRDFRLYWEQRTRNFDPTTKSPLSEAMSPERFQPAKKQ